MNNAKNSLELPAITKYFLRKEGLAVDNLFAEIWKSLKIPSLLTPCVNVVVVKADKVIDARQKKH